MKLKLYATDKDLMIKESERLISGSINMYTCEFTFDESWDGYTVTAVFSTNGSRLVNMAVVDGKCQIPHEVLRPNARIRVGIFGTDGVRSRPTTYSEWITVEQGADVSGNTAQPPTPSVYEQWMNGLDEKHKEWNENEQGRIEAENARVEAEQKREDLETGYVAQAKAAAENAEQAKQTAEEAAENAVANVENKLADHVAAAEAAQAAAEKARDEAQGIAGGDFASFAYVDQKASDAESNANKYTDQKISEIPTPDVSGQINAHNTDANAHADIREAVSNAEANANAYTNNRLDNYTDLGSFSGKTVADFRTALNSWLVKNAGVPNAKCKFSISQRWVDNWNAENTTTAMPGGYVHTAEVLAAHSANSVQIQIMSYNANDIYYTARASGTWLPVVQNATVSEIKTHNTAAEAHADIREAVASKAPMYTYGTTDLTAGSSPLATGQLHFVYE